LCWDLTEKKWAIWPKHVGRSERCLHSARLARRDFEKLSNNPNDNQARWLIYKNGRLQKARQVGYWGRIPIPKFRKDIYSDDLNSISFGTRLVLDVMYQGGMRAKA